MRLDRLPARALNVFVIDCLTPCETTRLACTGSRQRVTIEKTVGYEVVKLTCALKLAGSSQLLFKLRGIHNDAPLRLYASLMKWPKLLEQLPRDRWNCVVDDAPDHSYGALDLGHRHLDDEAIASLTSGLTPDLRLRRLSLVRNDVSDMGATALANLIGRCAALTYLDLRRNELGTLGVRAIAESLNRSSLRMLGLWSNRAEDSGASALADALRTLSLIHI